MGSSVLAVSLLFFAGAQASYPSAYPFENEAVVPPAPAAATPAFTFDDQDPGGYVYSFAYSQEIPEVPFCFTQTGLIAHQLVVRQGAPPMLPMSLWNCTARNFPISATTYINKIAEIEICPADKCCEHTWGLLAFFNNEPLVANYEQLSSAHTDGLCDEIFSEDVFCLLYNNGHSFACHESFPSPSERQVVYPCHDSVYNYQMQCKLYQGTGYKYRPETEPEAYYDTMSAEQINSWNGLYMSPDRVCQPYSYYYPDTAKSGSSGSSAASSALSRSLGVVAVVLALFF